MDTVFTSNQLASLSAEVDCQLSALQNPRNRRLTKGGASFRRVGPDSSETRPDSLPSAQAQVVEEITQEEPQGFLRRFARATRRDLCEEGGVLYEQWHKWADLNNKTVLEKYGTVLVAMGFTQEVIPMLVVALVVITLHLSAKTICEEYGQDASALGVGEEEN